MHAEIWLSYLSRCASSFALCCLYAISHNHLLQNTQLCSWISCTRLSYNLEILALPRSFKELHEFLKHENVINRRGSERTLGMRMKTYYGNLVCGYRYIFPD